MIWTFHRRLWHVAFVHTFFGEAGPFLAAVTNYFQPFVMSLANTSIANHYHHYLDTNSYAWTWSFISSLDTMGNFIGAALLGIMLDNIGRKNTVMIVRNIISCLSCIMIGLAQPTNSIEMLALGRMMTGFCGACSNAMYMFLSECAPDNVRGTMPMLLGMGSGFWEFMATIMALPYLLGTKARWPFFMIVPIIPNLIHIVYAFIFPESPKYLYVHKRDEEKTIRSLVYYHGNAVDLDHELEHLEKENVFQSAKTVSYSTILSNRHLRMPLFISIVCALSGIFNGNQLSNQYSAAILVLLGIPRQYSLLVIMFNMLISASLGIANAIYFIEKIGRRRMQLLNITIALVGSSCLCIATLMAETKDVAATSKIDAHLTTANRMSMVIGFIGFLCISLSYGFGIVTIPKILIGELNPQATRGRVATAVYLITNSVNFLIVLFWPPLQTAIGGYSILPITISELCCFIWLIKYLPETHNRPVSQIVAQWYDGDLKGKKKAPLLSQEDEMTPLLADRRSTIMSESTPYDGPIVVPHNK